MGEGLEPPISEIDGSRIEFDELLEAYASEVLRVVRDSG